ELRRRGLVAMVEQGDDDRIWVEVSHGSEIDFYYSVRPRPYDPPAFAINDTRDDRTEALKYCRAEVHLREGGQDYDIMGWREETVINDVLDHYGRHLRFLAAVR